MPKKNEPTKAEAIRAVLTKHPDFNAKQAVAALAKSGVEINAANFYDTKSRMTEQGLVPGVKKSKRKVKRSCRKISKPESTISESVELELARREIQKLRAVIATLL
ncbi:MAG: hypothetical protein M0R80_02475 [Proteobacteria bacterium]|jgi:hypothetical protein|nr:hypothetical protein [Pseudomonadota bacterium]